MNILKYLLPVLACAYAAPALADNESGQFAVEGVGKQTCAEFVRDRADQNSGAYQRLMGFVEGYLTAANRYEPNTFDLTPWHNAGAFDLILESHCTAHPEDTLVSVVQRMVTGFRPIRLAQFSPLLEVGTDSAKTYVYEAILKRAQAALHMRNLYSGPEDGRFTPELKAAIITFQRSANLTPSGVPDAATLWTLLNP